MAIAISIEDKKLRSLEKEEVVCFHCGEECADINNITDEKHFCCDGCKAVYLMLSENGLCSYYEIDNSKVFVKWFPYHKGGEYRKWYGNLEHLLLWKNNGQLVKNNKSSVIRNENYYLRPFGGWSSLTSGKLACRFFYKNVIMDQKGPGVYSESNDINQISIVVAFFNSVVFQNLIQLVSPTLDYTAGTIDRVIPYKNIENQKILFLSNQNINISKEDAIERYCKYMNMSIEEFDHDELTVFYFDDEFDAYSVYPSNN
jgi:hypothetical protein